MDDPADIVPKPQYNSLPVLRDSKGNILPHVSKLAAEITRRSTESASFGRLLDALARAFERRGIDPTAKDAWKTLALHSLMENDADFKPPPGPRPLSPTQERDAMILHAIDIEIAKGTHNSDTAARKRVFDAFEQRLVSSPEDGRRKVRFGEASDPIENFNSIVKRRAWREEDGPTTPKEDKQLARIGRQMAVMEFHTALEAVARIVTSPSGGIGVADEEATSDLGQLGAIEVQAF